jgi:hypothetical protein
VALLGAVRRPLAQRIGHRQAKVVCEDCRVADRDDSAPVFNELLQLRDGLGDGHRSQTVFELVRDILRRGALEEIAHIAAVPGWNPVGRENDHIVFRGEFPGVERRRIHDLEGCGKRLLEHPPDPA